MLLADPSVLDVHRDYRGSAVPPIPAAAGTV